MLFDFKLELEVGINGYNEMWWSKQPIMLMALMFVVFPKGRIIFYEEGEGGVWRFYGGGHIFSEPKKGGHVFFQGLILIFF